MIESNDTASQAYADRLQTIQRAWWKRLLPVQAPYQWYLRRQKLGRTLEVGCGIGRNLASLDAGSIGIDHNAEAVAYAKTLGLRALTTQEWETDDHRKIENYDGLLLSHVLEHMTEEQAIALLKEFSAYLRPGGRAFIICPQECGFCSDSTHVAFMDGAALTRIARSAGLRPDAWRSFPFPRWMGKFFIFNEFCLSAEKPESYPAHIADDRLQRTSFIDQFAERRRDGFKTTMAVVRALRRRAFGKCRSINRREPAHTPNYAMTMRSMDVLPRLRSFDIERLE